MPATAWQRDGLGPSLPIPQWSSCLGHWAYLGHSITHTHLMALCPWPPGRAGTRKLKPIWILLKQETVSGSGIRWAICKSAPLSRQITRQHPTAQFFYRQDALPATQPTVSKHWVILLIDSKHLIAKLLLENSDRHRTKPTLVCWVYAMYMPNLIAGCEAVFEFLVENLPNIRI